MDYSYWSILEEQAPNILTSMQGASASSSSSNLQQTSHTLSRKAFIFNYIDKNNDAIGAFHRMLKNLVMETKKDLNVGDTSFISKLLKFLPKQDPDPRLEACYFFNKSPTDCVCHGKIIHSSDRKNPKSPDRIYLHICLFCLYFNGYWMCHPLHACPMLKYLDTNLPPKYFSRTSGLPKFSKEGSVIPIYSQVKVVESSLNNQQLQGIHWL